MRQLARFENEQRAHLLADALTGEGIGSLVQESREGDFVVWVHDEMELDRARTMLAAYEAAPDDPRFREARKKAAAHRERERKTTPPPMVRVRPPMARGLGSVTFVLIAISIAVGVFTRVGENQAVVQQLTIASYRVGRGFFATPGWGDILGGEVWRLITPIFLHFGYIHIFFNLWWLKDLGTMIERVQGSLVFLFFVLVLGIVSNVTQFVMTGLPNFGGMSGVVYGLFGYVWMRGRYDPGSGLFLPQSAIVVLMIWFVLCWTVLAGQIANWAHTAGLVLGMLFGIASARPLWRKVRR